MPSTNRTSEETPLIIIDIIEFLRGLDDGEQVGYSEIADEIGRKHKTVRDWGKHSALEPYRVGIVGGKTVFNNSVVDASYTAEDLEPDEWIETIDDGKPLQFYNDRYVYNEHDDTYLTWLPMHSKPIVLSGDSHRSMIREYSNWDGRGATINQMCSTFGFARNEMMSYLNAHGVTHDKEPFTREEVDNEDPNDLADRVHQMKRRQLIRKTKLKDWSSTKEAAEKWWAFEDGTVNPLVEAIQDGRIVPTQEHILRPRSQGVCAVISPSDFHFGKLGWSINGRSIGNNLEKAMSTLLRNTDTVISRALVHGVPDFIVLSFGGDWFHIDNDRTETTRGTIQHTSAMTLHDVLVDGCKLAVSLVEMIRNVAPVKIITVPGNHDQAHTTTLMMYLSAYYRNCDDVEINESTASRQYMRYGKNLFGFAHGKFEKRKDLPNLMANECAGDWGKCRSRVFFTGDKHHAAIQDTGGVLAFQLPSLAGADKWHWDSGYVTATRAIAGGVFDKERGHVAMILSDAVED